MKVLVGAIGTGGERRVLVGNASPSLRDIVDLTRDQIDWGAQASEESRERLAAIILGALVPPHRDIAGGMVIRFARDIVPELDAERMFIFTDLCVEQWLDRHFAS